MDTYNSPLAANDTDDEQDLERNGPVVIIDDTAGNEALIECRPGRQPTRFPGTPDNIDETEHMHPPRRLDSQSSGGSDEVIITFTAEMRVKKTEYQNKEEEIRRMFSVISLESKLANGLRNEVVEQQPLDTPVSKPMEAEGQMERAEFVVGENPTLFANDPFKSLTSSGIVKLFSDICQVLEERGEHLDPLYHCLELLLDKLKDNGTHSENPPIEAQIQSTHHGVTIIDVLGIVGKLQEFVDPIFCKSVNNHLPYWLTKSWMISRMCHSKSEHCISAFCSMCLQTCEDPPIKSHVYSESILKEVCGQSNSNSIWNALTDPPKPRCAPINCAWNLECKKCDRQTKVLEDSFLDRCYRQLYYDESETLDELDAILCHFFALRGLQVNVDLVYHCFFCCSRYVPQLLAFLERSLFYRSELNKINKPKELFSKLSSAGAKKWVLFCTKAASKHPAFLTEMPFLCQVDLAEINGALVGKIPLIYGQITNSIRSNGTKNHLCWAIPLVEDCSQVEHIKPHFPRIVDRVNQYLAAQHDQYFGSIDDPRPQGLKMIVGYLRTPRDYSKCITV